jgi:hypothetical protein
MGGLKKHEPSIRFSANKLTPDELDMRVRYMVLKPSIGTATLGTAAAGTVNVAWTVVNTVCDYPRNVLFTVVGPSGGVGGTTIINGTDQFGRGQSETITIGSANAGGTAAGTKIFDTITSGTYYPNGVDNTSTATLGYAFGTAAGIVFKLGLPVKIGATSDVKRITYIKNGAVTALNGGTIASYVSTATHSFGGTEILAATSDYVVDILSTYNSENDVNVA